MPPLRAIVIAAILATTALAGCFGGDELPTAYDASASGGAASDGLAYDGASLQEASATLEGSVDVSEDTGTLNISFEAWNSTWTVRHGAFSGQEEYKDGGIAQQLTVHGDTGAASPALPEMQLDLATWGSAEVLRDGAPYAITGDASEAWEAHLMLSKDTVRGPDGMITTEDESAPYDPANPTDARVIEDDPQAILELFAPAGEDAARQPATVEETFTFSPGTSPEADMELPTDAHARATVTVATNGTSGLQAGDIQVRIVDENGTVLEEDAAEITPSSPYEGTFEITGVEGPTTLQIRGNGTYEATVTGQVVYDDHAFIVITWDDYELEPR